AAGQVATFTIDSLLPERMLIYLRARLTGANGQVSAQALGQFTVQSWLRLAAPAQQRLISLDTRKPRFIWSSPPISLPPGPWEYDLTVINTRTALPVAFASGLNDTSFVFPDSLE